MDNFEKRVLLSYMKELDNFIKYNSSDFDEFISAFLKEFKLPKKDYESLNILLNSNVESFRLRNQKSEDIKKLLKEIVLKLEKKIKPTKSLPENQLNIVQDLYELNKQEKELLIFFIVNECPIFSNFFNCCHYASYPLMNGFCENYLKLKGAERSNAIENMYYKKLLDVPNFLRK